MEFAKRHPGWEPRFGISTRFDPDVNRYGHLYSLTGSVPEAKLEADAEKKVRDLLDEISQGLKSLTPKTERNLPKPIIRTWRWCFVAPSTPMA